MKALNELKQLSFFKDLTTKDLKDIAHLCEIKNYEKGAILFLEEQIATKLFTLVNGRIAIKIKSRGNSNTPVHTVEPGDAFSWSALVPPRRYTATAVAIQPSQVIVIKARKLIKLFKKNPSVGYTIMCRVAQLISKRVRHARFRILNNSSNKRQVA